MLQVRILFNALRKFFKINVSEKKFNFIYKTTCLVTSKYYIGMHSTNNLDDGYLGSGKILLYSIKLYGKENHKIEILENVNSRYELKNREIEIVNDGLLSDSLCMNLALGGGGGFISLEGAKKGRNKCDEVLKEKYGENFRSILAKNYHSNLSPEEKEIHITKIKNSHIGLDKRNFLGKTHKKETKDKISKSNSIKQKGVKNSQYGTCWITKEGINKKIKLDEIIEFEKDGWKRGRVLENKDTNDKSQK